MQTKLQQNSLPLTIIKNLKFICSQLTNLFNQNLQPIDPHNSFQPSILALLFEILQLIMDFINNHKSFFVAAGAVFAGIGLAVFLNRQNKRKESVPLPSLYEADLTNLKSGFQTKIEQIRSQIIGEGVPEELLVSIAQEIASYIEQRIREMERQDYFKAHESRLRNRFSIYVEMILLWQEEKKTQTQELIKEQEDILSSFQFSQEQVERVNRNKQVFRAQRIASTVTKTVIQQARSILSYKTQYLKEHGDTLFEDIINVCDSWKKESLQHLPNILNVIINEAVYSQHEEFINHLLEISWAFESFSTELDLELAAWDEAITPLYEKIMEKLEVEDLE